MLARVVLNNIPSFLYYDFYTKTQKTLRKFGMFWKDRVSSGVPEVPLLQIVCAPGQQPVVESRKLLTECFYCDIRSQVMGSGKGRVSGTLTQNEPLPCCPRRCGKTQCQDWGYSTVVKHLPGMREALGLIPSTAKGGKKA